MIDCPLSGRSLGYVSNFCISDLENFATASRRCIGAILLLQLQLLRQRRLFSFLLRDALHPRY